LQPSKTLDLYGFSSTSYKNTRTTQKALCESKGLFVNEAPFGHEVASSPLAFAERAAADTNAADMEKIYAAIPFYGRHPFFAISPKPLYCLTWKAL